MSARRLTASSLAIVACLLAAGCSATVPAVAPAPTAGVAAIPAAVQAHGKRLLDWPEFGLDPQRSDVSERPAGITAANVRRLRRIVVHVPGTIDSSPIYLHGVSVGGVVRNVVVVTSTYGRTIAIDADRGTLLWTFAPSASVALAGSSQITTASPLADPTRMFVYAASPDGRIHKLAVSDGAEVRTASWPARITRDPSHEKIAAALNIAGGSLIAATGGYVGDAPPYQGHVVLIDRVSGRLQAIFNTLCATRRELLVPSGCSSSDSAILSRGGPVVEPGGGRILIDTGNGPWNGTTDFGDSVVELNLAGLELRQSFTPVNQAQLRGSDSDLGSSAPALLGGDRALVGGKDGVLRVLALSRLDGHPPSGARARLHPLGGEVQRLATPGGGELFTAPAVWRRGGHTTVFVANGNGTAAFVLRGGRLYLAWQNGTPGTSPVMAGGLLYVYDPDGGAVDVYRPSSARPIAALAAAPGHWNSPIVADGHVVVPVGNGNDHRSTGVVEIFSAP
jgi:hypothetical protein